jgi:hypothetical protein
MRTTGPALSRLIPAGLLLGGFLLIEPPVVHQKVDKSAPLSKWTHISNFDDHQSCQDALDARVANSDTGLGVMAEEDGRNGSLTAADEARMASRCVKDTEVY